MRCAARPSVCIYIFTVCQSRARARRGRSTLSVILRTTTRVEPCSLRRARWREAAGRYVSVCQSETQRVLGSGRVSPTMCERARRGQWTGSVLAGAAVAATLPVSCWRASESAGTGHVWPHADSAPWARSWNRPCTWRTFLGNGPRPCGPARGRGQAGRSLVPLLVRFAGPPPSLDVCCRPPFIYCSSGVHL